MAGTNPANPNASTTSAAAGSGASTAAAASGGSISMLFILGIVAIVIVIGGVLYFVVLQGGGVTSSGTESGTPPALQAALQSSSTDNFANVTNVISQRVNSTNELEINYSGTITFSSSALSLLGLSIPVKVGFEKYYNATKTYFSAKDIPIFGNLTSVVVVPRPGIEYECSESETFSLNSSTQSSGSTPTLQCTNETSSLGMSSGLSFNASTLGKSGIGNFSFTEQKHITYNGQGCTLVSASGGGPIANESNTTEHYSIGTCLSDEFYLPLNVTGTVQLTSKSTGFNLGIDVNEVSISHSTTLSNVTSLPAPLTNGQVNMPGLSDI